MTSEKTAGTDFGNCLGIEPVALEDTDSLNAVNGSPDVDEIKASAIPIDIHRKFLMPRMNNAESPAAAEIPGADSPTPED